MTNYMYSHRSMCVHKNWLKTEQFICWYEEKTENNTEVSSNQAFS